MRMENEEVKTNFKGPGEWRSQAEELEKSEETETKDKEE